MIIPALRTRLLASTAIAALVGTRVFPVYADQAAVYPLIVLQEISGEKVLYTQGESGLAVSRVQVDCWATTYLGARDLADKVRLQISGFTGTMGTVVVQDCQFENTRDTIEISAENESRQVFGCVQDYEVWFVQTAPDYTT